MITDKSDLIKQLHQNLTDNILAYWIENTPDNENGGFIGHINFDNKKIANADKGAILNARILWTFSIAAINLKNKEYTDIAHRAFKYIKDFFIDKKYGGVYWSVDYKGNPSERKKQIYAQSFTIYGMSEYYKLTKNTEALEISRKIYELIEKYSFDTSWDGYIEAYDEDWSELDDVRLSEREINSKKTMNTHLHILEAYTNLFRIWPDRLLYHSLKNLIQVFINHFIKNTYHLQLFFDEHWTPLDNIVSFGHDIECSWLLAEAAEVLGDKLLIRKTRDFAVKMTDACKEGFSEDGGMMYEIEENGTLDTDKHWWPQAEALVGLTHTYQITKDNSYLEKVFKLWKFIDNKIIDKETGEWFYKVDKNGNISPENEKVGFWKCPYHNARACLEVITRLSE